MASKQLALLHEELYSLYPLLEGSDHLLAKGVATDLAWAAEHCAVIAKHLDGQCLNDVPLPMSQETMLMAAGMLREKLHDVPSITVGVDKCDLIVYYDQEPESPCKEFRGLRVIWRHITECQNVPQDGFD